MSKQELIKQLEVAKESLHNAESCGEQTGLTIEAANGDPSLVKKEIAAINQKYASLLDQLKNKQMNLEEAIEQGTEIKEKLDDIQEWTADGAKIVAAWEPVSTDSTVANKQLRQLEVCFFFVCLSVVFLFQSVKSHNQFALSRKQIS